MSRQQFGGKYDQVVADEVNKDAEERKALRCQAHGCPDRKSTRLNSSHIPLSRMPSSA